MSQIIRTQKARQDFSDIFQYIAQYDTEQAKNLLLLIDEKCELLAKFPAMGRTRHELLLNLRSFPVKNYVVFTRRLKTESKFFGFYTVRVILPKFLTKQLTKPKKLTKTVSN